MSVIKGLFSWLYIRLPYIMFLIGVLTVVFGVWVLYPPLTVLTAGGVILVVSRVEDVRRESMAEYEKEGGDVG